MSEPEPEPQITYNNFKASTVRGVFNNSDSPDGTQLANATFDRDVSINGDLILGDFTTQTGGNIHIKVNDIENIITPAELLASCKTESATIDQFVLFYDQFATGSQLGWGMI